ncbi:MAG: hypothetical protein AB1607_13125 [Chloroflexota bacterium]
MDILQTLINGAFGLLGVILGYVLSEQAAKRREERERGRRNESSRELIALEIDMNIKELKELWDEISKDWKDQDELTNQPSKRDLAKKFIERPFDAFSKKAFESQYPIMADALNSLEVIQVFQFYDRLKGVENIREKLDSSMQLQMTEERNAVVETKGLSRAFKPHPRPFDNQAAGLWDECRSLISQTFAKGNPIRKK